MMRIVDTSVAVKWFTIEDNHEAAKAIIGEALLAPDLLMAEVSNALWKKCRIDEIGREQAFLAQSIMSSFVEFLPSGAFAIAALQIALELDHPVYDCFFLAVSESEGLPLVTSDKRLIRRCAGTRFEELLQPLQ